MCIKKLAVLASGAGSTLEYLIHQIQKKNLEWTIPIVISDKANSGAIEIAKRNKIAVVVSASDQEICAVLTQYQPDLILLAGYMRKIESETLNTFKGRIINTHPSLLPKYGGKGMYGRKIHETVFQNKDRETGITIHSVNENYDEGKILFQHKLILEKGDSAESIERKVKDLEKEMLLRFLQSH